MTLSLIISISLMVVFDWALIYKTGYPCLSIIISKLRYSKRFKWLTYNVFGNDDAFYERVYKRMKMIELKQLSGKEFKALLEISGINDTNIDIRLVEKLTITVSDNRTIKSTIDYLVAKNNAKGT